MVAVCLGRDTYRTVVSTAYFQLPGLELAFLAHSVRIWYTTYCGGGFEPSLAPVLPERAP